MKQPSSNGRGRPHRRGCFEPGSSTRRGEPKTSDCTYRTDSLFPRVERAVLRILETKKFVAIVDVFVDMDILRAVDLEAWRFGRVHCLEQVVHGNLSKLRRILRIVGLYCHDLNLSASTTVYTRLGKGKSTPLRFSKTGVRKLEDIYSRHFVWPGKGPFRVPAAMIENTENLEVADRGSKSPGDAERLQSP